MRLSWIVLVIAICVSCEKSTLPDEPPKPDPRLALDLPQVTTGYDRFDSAPLTLTAGETAIVVDGTSIVSLRNGVVDPSELDGGAQGRKISKLNRYIKNAVVQTKADRAAVLFDRDYTYMLLINVIFSMKADDTGLRRYDFVAKANGALVSIPIVLPEKSRPGVRVGGHDPSRDLARQIGKLTDEQAVPVGGDLDEDIRPAPHPDDMPLGLFVSIMKDRMILWSLTALEGTLRDPQYVYRPDAAGMKKLNADLTSIAERRWGGRPRPPSTTEIVIQADAATKLQTIAEVFGAVRKDAKGRDLFPEIQLAMGFE